MLNENRIKVMARMAMYEKKQGDEDLKINAYYKRDYVSYKTLISVIWVTIAYALVVVLAASIFLDEILQKISVDFIVMSMIGVVGVYLCIMLFYVIGASTFYKKKYSDARERLKKFNHNLTRLNKMYEKERR